MKYGLPIVGLAVGAMLMSIPQGPANADTQQDLAKGSIIEGIKKSGRFKVGVGSFQPWVMRGKTGEMIGFEVDIATKAAEDMEAKAEFFPTAWDGIIPALLARKFDVIISGMSITPARALQVNFSIPYAHTGSQLVCSKKLAAGMTSPADFNKAHIKIGGRRGASGSIVRETYWPKAQAVLYDDNVHAYLDVVNGNLHCAGAAPPKGQFEVLKNPEMLFLPFENLLGKTDEAFVMRKGDPDAITFFNAWIQYNTTQGFIPTRWKYWFTTFDWIDQVETSKYQLKK